MFDYVISVSRLQKSEFDSDTRYVYLFRTDALTKAEALGASKEIAARFPKPEFSISIQAKTRIVENATAWFL